MERRAKVELFEQIRREYEFGAGTIKGVARKFKEDEFNNTGAAISHLPRFPRNCREQAALEHLQ
jgi:hypothetical protein